MEIVVMLKPEYLSLFLHSQAATLEPAVREIQAALDELGVTLEQMHPGTDDPTLGLYFVVRGKGARDPENIVRGLGKCRAIDGAYAMPKGSPP